MKHKTGVVYTELKLNMTFGNGGWMGRFCQTAAFTPDLGTENRVVNLYPEATAQTLEGFGGAITDAAGYVYSLLSPAQKSRLMETYFRPERMNYRLVRIPIDSCDFSLEQHAAVSDPADTELKSFSFAGAEKYILPMLRDAQAAAGQPLELMLTPWSPPAFMKTNGRREGGGALKPEYRDMWAEYLCRYIEEYQSRGFRVRRISIQNEAKAVQPWDSCIFTAGEEKQFLRDHLYPALTRHGLCHVEVFIWDHNKERVYERLRDMLDADTGRMVAGAAFHWYSGDHFEALRVCRDRFPDKKLIASESCMEFWKYGAEDGGGAARRLAREMLGDLNHGACAFYDWNLLLDDRGGPNYTGNYCLAPFHYDAEKQQLRPQLVQEYYEHFTHNLLPGSVRIEHTCFSDAVEATAWKRPDGTLALVLLNRSRESQPVCLRLEGMEAGLVLMPESIASGVIC